MATAWAYLAAIIPTIGVAVLFYYLVKAMLEGDRRERLAQSRYEADQERHTPRPDRVADTQPHQTAPRNTGPDHTGEGPTHDDSPRD